MRWFPVVLLTWTLAAAHDVCIRGYLHVMTTLFDPEKDQEIWPTLAIDTINSFMYYTTENKNGVISLRDRYLQSSTYKQGSHLFDFKVVRQLAVDKHTTDLYIAGNNVSSATLNLYKYVRDTKELSLLAENIHEGGVLYNLCAYRNKVYWANPLHSLMHRYSDGKVGKSSVQMKAYAEDFEGSMYFIKKKLDQNVYKVKKGQRTQLRYLTSDSLDLLKVDADWKVYAAGGLTRKLYEISDEHGRIVAVSDKMPGSVYYLDFDQANDIIFFNVDRFYKLSSTLKQCQYIN